MKRAGLVALLLGGLSTQAYAYTLWMTTMHVTMFEAGELSRHATRQGCAQELAIAEIVTAGQLHGATLTRGLQEVIMLGTVNGMEVIIVLECAEDTVDVRADNKSIWFEFLAKQRQKTEGKAHE